MSLISHAEKELKLAGFFNRKDMYNGEIEASVIELLKVFEKQNLSGAIAGTVVDLFKKLAMWEILQPLTGEDDEWNCRGESSFQNKRLYSVFKDGKDGRPYYLYAILWKYPNGACGAGRRHGIDSTQYIKSFPFVPKTFTIDIDEHENIKDMRSLYEAIAYYGISTTIKNTDESNTNKN